MACVEYKDDREDVIARAKAKGLEVWLSDETSIQVDCDTLDQLCLCLTAYRSCKNYLGLFNAKATHSKSGRWHIHIQGPPRDTMARIAIQAALGSDPNRELLNVRDKEEDRENEPFLIEVPGQVMHEFNAKYLKVQETRLAMERVRGKPFTMPEIVEVEKTIRENL